MNNKTFRIIVYSFLLVVGTYFLFLGLFKARGFLIPLSLGVFLSLVMLPVAAWLEHKGLSRGMAVLLSDFIILVFCAFVVFVVSMEVYQIVSDWPKYERQLQPKYEKVLQFVSKRSGASMEEIKSKVEESITSTGAGSKDESDIPSKVVSFFGKFLLVFVYIFFLMYYRGKIKNSILSFIPEEKRNPAREIINQASRVSQQYLFGRFILILILAALYAAGLIILGVKQAVLVALLAALLSLIPYIGNIIGYSIALLLGTLSGNGLSTIIGITVVFAVTQFVESYLLEPFIVGQKVDLNPLFTIVGVVLLGVVWGLAGMFIAIPAMGILKVVSDNVPALNPIGYMLGTEDISTESGWIKKFKRWMQNQKEKLEK